MADQLGLPGFGADAPPTDRLFFGLYPPEPVQARISALGDALRAAHGLRGKPHHADRLHVTLFHIGDYAGLPGDVVAKAKAAAGALAVPPFAVVFDRAKSFSSQPRNRPFTLQGGEGVTALIAMRQALALEMMKAGLGREARTGFTPHVTLLYDDKAVEEQAVEPIGWTVDGFTLVHSHLGKTRHDHLQTWPLKA